MIEVRELHKRFGTHHVLRGVNLHIEKGEAVVIIGRSGCGKSILLKHLIGLMPAEEGDVVVDGRSLKGLDERQLLHVRRKFGMLFQSSALFDSMTVAENVGFALRRVRRFSEQEITRQVGEALEMVELPGTESKKPSQLSGGMRKRVGLARAIVYRPQIILYDEPTTGLDPIMADSIDRLIVRICDRLKVTSIAVTHDMRSAGRIGRRILMLEEGRIYVSAPPDELFRSKDPVVHRFVHGVSDAREQSFQP
jgi:phospholipid/cholesterol/gamma-HCH transport system ATP-binding protein